MSERTKKYRKQFWIPFFVLIGPLLFLIFYSLGFSEESLFISFALIGLYIGSYINGYQQGRESLRQVLDFMEPGLRWKVSDAEEDMYDKEDRDYYNSQK